MPSRIDCSRPSGIRPSKSRHHAPARHYYANGSWHNPYCARESRYSDFVPCTYDERTLLTRLYKYARDFLAQTNGNLLQRSPISNCRRSGSCYSPSDIEMITSSPSPTLHASTTSCSPRSYDGSYRFSTTQSPRPYIKPPPPAAFPRTVSHSPTAGPNPNKRPLSVHTPTKTTVDAGTQYSPPTKPVPSAFDRPNQAGKRRGTTPSPLRLPPEPALEPQMPPKRPAVAAPPPPTPDSQTATTSSTTIAQTSSSSSQGSSPKRARGAKPAVKYMPAQYETCDVKDLVLLISNMLLELIRFNDEIPLKDGRLTRFHSRAPPGIGVKDYLQRLTTHATLSPPILLSMVYYIDRLCALYPAFTISSLTVHRFLITSATVASKGLSDSFWTNNTYARVGGVSLKELALLELEFLWRVEWRIVPKPEVLVDYYRSLVERSEGFKIAEEEKSDKTSEKSSERSSSSEGEMDVVDASLGKERAVRGSVKSER
ncbi:hypothetical protein N7G274_010605 [Stereocaulon virgatum]|uniref:Cyclin-domain-containing protein n=1 Tax=Stereocaulon virgatum TaxID=373712 RepID=A0ABR3ZU93_9LECA